MRIHLSHETTYRYGLAPTGMIQTLRMTPRGHDGQDVITWRIEVSDNCRLKAQEDAFGNIVHALSIDSPASELRVLVEGQLETRDTQGLVRGTIERFPPTLFLRDTALTEADDAIIAYAQETSDRGQRPVLDTLHDLVARLHNDIAFDTDPTHVATTAAEAFALKRGVCQDLTHIFIAAARRLGIPARYVGGYFRRADGVIQQQAGHAWAEAFVPNLEWVAFDPTNGICATDAHVRVAVGLDYLGAAPVRGARYGGQNEVMDVQIHIDQMQRQAQN